jgi:hypothetical protein
MALSHLEKSFTFKVFKESIAAEKIGHQTGVDGSESRGWHRQYI